MKSGRFALCPCKYSCPLQHRLEQSVYRCSSASLSVSRRKEGRIYGVTFIDHDSRVVLNGSRLGKEYSANVFNERFSGETGKMHQPEVSAPQQDQSTHQEQPGFTPKSDIVSGVASVLGAFGGLLGGGASGGDEPQDIARQKRKKKKKRTRRID